MSERICAIKHKEAEYKSNKYFNISYLSGQIHVKGLEHNHKTFIFTNSSITYFEAEIKTNSSTSLRVGFATEEAEKFGPLGYDRNSWYFQTMNGYGIHNGKKRVFGERVTTNDVVGCMLDRKKQRIYFFVNGVLVDKHFKLDKNELENVLYPAISCYNFSECQINIGPFFKLEECSLLGLKL